MLRNQLPAKIIERPLPALGVNLRDLPHTLQAGEAQVMQNCYHDGGIRPIPGSTLLTSSQLAASKAVRGGFKAYWATAGRSAKRLLAYSTKVSVINDAGAESVLSSGYTEADTFFASWSITDKVYLTNGTTTLWAYDNSTIGAVTGTAIPTPIGPVVPVLDRLFAITTNGIEHTNPRSDSVWSNNSSWATFRPVRPGQFTVIHPFSLRDSGIIYPGALAFQQNAYYILSGSDYGADVTAGSASAGYNASFQLLDPTIGTSSPRGICTVPGVGIFWVTSDLNVYWLPEGMLKGQYVGDKLYGRFLTRGLESTNLAAISKIQLTYFNRKLILRFPSGSSTFNNQEFWLDLRYLLSGDQTPTPVWYGPMTISTASVLWREDQGGDLALMGGEGDTSVGVFVYNLQQSSVVTHASGTSTLYPALVYQERYDSYVGGHMQKYIPYVRMTAQVSGALPTLGVADLNAVGAIQGTVSLYE